jgi:hypothetical protein
VLCADFALSLLVDRACLWLLGEGKLLIKWELCIYRLIKNTVVLRPMCSCHELQYSEVSSSALMCVYFRVSDWGTLFAAI